jgi:hypothetical protein
VNARHEPGTPPGWRLRASRGRHTKASPRAPAARSKRCDRQPGDEPATRPKGKTRLLVPMGKQRARVLGSALRRAYPGSSGRLVMEPKRVFEGRAGPLTYGPEARGTFCGRGVVNAPVAGCRALA